MRVIETNDWLTLNNIIYKIYTTEDLTDMRETLLENLTMVLDFDSAEFFLTVPENPDNLNNPVMYNCDTNNILLSRAKLEYSYGITYGGRSMIYRGSDILPDEERIETEYYKKIFRPNRWHYSLHMLLGMQKHFLGMITLYRTIGKENFQYDDIFLLDMLKDHLSFRLDQEYSKSKSNDKLNVEEASVQFDLTKRETTILRCLIQGKTNEQISEELMISVNTIKKHILNLYRKLGIKNRVQLFKMILEQE